MDAERWRPARRDVALALAFAVVAEVELRDSSQNILPGTVSLGLDSVLVLLPLVPLAWRSLHPTAVLVTMAATLTLVGAVLHGTLAFFGGLFPFLTAVYTASSAARHPWDRLALPLALLFYAPMPFYVGKNFDGFTDLLFASALACAAWLAGQGVWRWRRQADALATALSELESARAVQAELAVAAERTRIARELHDVVAHGLSVVVLQAQAARLEVPEDPVRAVEMVTAVETAGREALGEMRRLLGLLRSAEPTALEPAPSLASLPDLITQLSEAGLTTRVIGESGRLPASLDLMAYRIVQESLTNALRHAEPRMADLRFVRSAEDLHVTVTSPVTGDRAARVVGAGQGLVGIRERAVSLGGRMTACVQEGQFVVDVVLPLEEHVS
jgi:signal transduction histidine kinase